MEVIQLSSYTDEEKLQIAKNHLLPKQMKEHGLKKGSLRSTRRLRAIIRDTPGNPASASWSGGWPPSAERRTCSCCQRL